MQEKEKRLRESIAAGRQLQGILDELLQTGDWSASPFLETASKQLALLRTTLQKSLESMSAEEVALSTQQEQRVNDCIKVYVSLYQANGNQVKNLETTLKNWTLALKNLSQWSSHHSVYSQEEQVRAVIRTKADKQCVAYAGLFIKKEDILSLPEGQTPVDRLGNKLLTLKPKAIQLENIREFVCFTPDEKRYAFIPNEGLVPKEEVVPEQAITPARTAAIAA